ncbi:hypothetical protein [Pantanalinema sp. GBBB05]|uniref:hypothetical protein n=1 Tax=Pantanalinema sp. GBBB05 TaxID=2604139 RepID=UPI001DE75A97|nr:hypothetical protein [Pantanalinema sp. GBBB05]
MRKLISLLLIVLLLVGTAPQPARADLRPVLVENIGGGYFRCRSTDAYGDFLLRIVNLDYHLEMLNPAEHIINVVGTVVVLGGSSTNINEYRDFGQEYYWGPHALLAPRHTTNAYIYGSIVKTGKARIDTASGRVVTKSGWHTVSDAATGRIPFAACPTAQSMDADELEEALDKYMPLLRYRMSPSAVPAIR